jgi:hypothetical protein
MSVREKYLSHPMNEGEIAALKKGLKRAYLTRAFFGCMISVLYFILVFVINGGVSRLNSLFIILINILIFSITVLLTNNLRLDISDGIKALREFQILNKISFMDREPEAEGTKIKYQLISKYNKFTVDKVFYDKMKINDWIIEHSTPLSNELLKLELK